MVDPLEPTPLSAPTDIMMSGFTFTFVLISVAIIAITVAISVPLTGAVIRLRAQYNPKVLQLDPECDVQPCTNPVVRSSFAMLVRVGRIEGFSGLYKGLMPTLLGMLMAIVPLSLLVSSGVFNGTYIPFYGVQGTLVFSAVNLLIYVPLAIITNRAITTPYKLSYFDAIHSLRILLTPAERQRPWILYQTPGLFVTVVLQNVFVFLCVRIRRLLLPQITQPDQLSSRDLLLRLAMLLVFSLASRLILVPLQVISLRLTLQRNLAAPEYNLTSQEETDVAETVEYFGTDENVISLRTEGEPYAGLLDCAKKIIKEEGWGALYSAWWWTAFSTLPLSLS